MIEITRRSAWRGLIAFGFAGGDAILTPRQARAAHLPFGVLTPSQVKTLDALGETMLPGAAEDGISHFVDHQLGIPAEEALLTLRYLDVPPPYAGFYESGLAALDAASEATYGRPFASLPAANRNNMVTALAAGTADGWTGAPAAVFYFCLRSDAVDVVYGTVDGFARLGIPYNPHILPPRRW